MYSIDTFSIEPVSKSVNPEIKIVAGLKAYGHSKIPLSFHGALVDRDETRIASLSEWEIPYRNPVVIYTESSREKDTITGHLYFQLTRKAIKYLESLRSKNENRDLDLTIRLTIGTLISQMSDPQIYAEVKNDEVLNPNNLFRFRGEGSHPSSDKINLVSADRNGEVLKIQYDEQKRNFTISSSDWAQKYCPALGVGKFATVDLYIPKMDEPKGQVEKYLNAALDTVEQMEKYLRQGEWSDVIKESRQLAEIFKEQKGKNGWIKMLKSSGFTEESIEDLNSMLQSFFDFSSKFIHRTDRSKDRNLMEKVKVEKEDAYYIYATSIGLVNMISKKVKAFNEAENK